MSVKSEFLKYVFMCYLDKVARLGFTVSERKIIKLLQQLPELLQQLPEVRQLQNEKLRQGNPINAARL